MQAEKNLTEKDSKMRSLFGFKTKEQPKEDIRFWYKIEDIEKAAKESLEELEGIKIQEEDDRIKNFFNGKFLKAMKKELTQIEHSVNDLTRSQKKIIESLDAYMEGIKKKFEERIDAAKMALFESILQKSLEVNTSLSDLTISSTKLQKKLFGMREEFSTKGNVNKTLIPDMLKAFQEYKTNLIKIREEDLAEGTIERICLRMDTQTQKCAVQLDKLIEANLHPDQIIISGKAEIINVTALNMLELDDTRSTWSHEEDDRSVDRKFNAIY